MHHILKTMLRAVFTGLFLLGLCYSGNQLYSQEDLHKLDLAEAAKKHIKNKAQRNGGTYPLKDIPQGRKLDLNFIKIHKDRIGTINKNEFFVCAAFRGENGDRYDVDIFLRKTGKGNYRPSGKKPKVRKEDGEPRYTWEKEKQHYTKANKGLKAKKIHPDQDEIKDAPVRSVGSNKPSFNNNSNKGNNQRNRRGNFQKQRNNGRNNNRMNNNRMNNSQNMPGNNRPGNNRSGNMPGNNNVPVNNNSGNNTPGNDLPNKGPN